MPLAIAALVALTGCVPPTPIDTPSGFPSVQIAGTTKQIKDFILSEFAPGGWHVLKSDEYTLIIATSDDSTSAMILAGTRMSPTPEARKVFTFSPVGSETLVNGRASLVSNPGTAFERPTEYGRGSQENYYMQSFLLRAKMMVERKR